MPVNTGGSRVHAIQVACTAPSAAMYGRGVAAVFNAMFGPLRRGAPCLTQLLTREEHFVGEK